MSTLTPMMTSSMMPARGMTTARVVTTIYECLALGSRSIVGMTLAVIMLTMPRTLPKSELHPGHTLCRCGPPFVVFNGVLEDVIQ